MPCPAPVTMQTLPASLMPPAALGSRSLHIMVIVVAAIADWWPGVFHERGSAGRSAGISGANVAHLPHAMDVHSRVASLAHATEVRCSARGELVLTREENETLTRVGPGTPCGLGPQPVPLLPRWDLFVRPDGLRQIVAHRLGAP
jgi:hypothetical protein